MWLFVGKLLRFCYCRDYSNWRKKPQSLSWPVFICIADSTLIWKRSCVWIFRRFHGFSSQLLDTSAFLCICLSSTDHWTEAVFRQTGRVLARIFAHWAWGKAPGTGAAAQCACQLCSSGFLELVGIRAINHPNQPHKRVKCKQMPITKIVSVLSCSLTDHLQTYWFNVTTTN